MVFWGRKRQQRIAKSVKKHTRRAKESSMSKTINVSKNRKGEKIMAMSKDRVKFKIQNCRLFSSEADGYLRLLKDVFGINNDQAKKNAQWQDLYIICRPSQFARFLIMRNNMSLRNGFQELEPELYLDGESPATIDVSGNYNHFWNDCSAVTPRHKQ